MDERAAGRHSRRNVLKAGGLALGGALVPGTLAAGRAAAQPGAAGADAAVAPAAPGSAAPASPWDQVPAILARISPPTFPDRDFDITAYGAKGDGKADNTAAFRRAIEACNQAGGGRVVVPRGTFLTGAVTLLSNVNLYVGAGATVRFSTDPKKYPLVFTRWQGIECMNFSPFIYAYGQTNLAITGPGTLDGQGPSGPWFDYDTKRDPDWQRLQQLAVDEVPPERRIFGSGHFLKPNFIQLYRCENILISDIRMRNSAMWNIHPVLARNVTVRGVSIYSRGGMVDGCNPESSADVHVTGCTFDTGDDAVVVKSGRDIDGRRVGVASEDIVVENCTMLGRWGAVTVGSEMSGGARNIFFQDCTIRPGPSYRTFYALYIKTNKRRGGVIDGVHARRITGDDIDRGSIYVDMNYSLTGPGFGPIVNPTVQNITVDAMKIDGAPYALKLDGLADSHVRHVHISNSTFKDMDSASNSIKNADDVRFTNTTINGRPAGG
jgi:polygalacturonase